MSRFNATIRTKFGEIGVQFDELDELKKALSGIDVEGLESVVSQSLGKVIPKDQRKPKPGMEALYGFTAEGRIELYKVAKSATFTIGLIMYAYDPSPVSTEELKRLVGKHADSYLSNDAYKTYFTRVEEGVWTLSQEGRMWIQKDVIPSLTVEPNKEGKHNG